jgi:nicotinamide mononucleotide (NMN) deamidase PncC
VGTVWLAVALAAPAVAGGAVVTAERLQLDGDRAAVREHTVLQALQRLRATLG